MTKDEKEKNNIQSEQSDEAVAEKNVDENLTESKINNEQQITEKEEMSEDEVDTSPMNKDLENKENDNIEYVESPYLKNQFLHFGFDHDLDFIDVNSTFDYLQSSGFADNSLTQARERIWESKLLEQE